MLLKSCFLYFEILVCSLSCVLQVKCPKITANKTLYGEVLY